MTNYFLLRTADGFVGYWNGDLTAGRGLSLNVPRALGLTFGDPFEANVWAERISAETGEIITVIDKDGEDMTAVVEDAANWSYTHGETAEPCGLPCGHPGECRRDDVDDNAAWLTDMVDRFGHGGI